MKRKIFVMFVGSMLLLTIGSWVGIHAQEAKEQKSRLTVPWDEFKKLMHLDENEIIIPMETFQKILAQTGMTIKPAYTVKEGNVVLTRTEFEKIINRMKPPPGIDVSPPFNYLITKAIYSGKMLENNTAFEGIFHVHILKKDAYLKIPFLPQTIALENVKVDGKQALIVSESGYHHVVLSKPGAYILEASFSLKSSLERGPHRLDLSIQQTPITLLRLELPLRDIDVEIPEARQVLTSLRGGSTFIDAIIAPGRVISVRWRKKVEIAEKIEPKLYCEIYHLISIEDDALKISSDINYNILHSEVDGVRISIPEEMNVLTVHGEGVGEWQETVTDDQRLISIPFTYGKKGNVTVHVTSEKTLSETGPVTSFSGIKTLETVRETGFIGIELNTSAEVNVTESEGLERVAVQKLPRPLYNKSVKPLIYGFKYLKHPYHLVLDIKKHDKIAVPVATISSANVVTLFTEDGKVVHRLVYQVRNSSKQFLKISLPKEADVWSVFVGNEPVESSMNGMGELLVPLIRSRSVENRLDTFPVEVIYCLVEKRFSMLNTRESSLPAVDLLMSQIIWSMYLPNDYSYLYFKSTLEKEEMIRGLNVFARSRRQFDEEAMQAFPEPVGEEQVDMDKNELKRVYKGKDYKSTFRNLPLKEDQLSSQIHAELEFSGRLEGLAQQEMPQAVVSGGETGILPIQIEIPTGGQVYRFAKTIVKSEDSLFVSVLYTQNWVVKVVRWFIILLILWILYLKRKTVKRIVSWLKEKYNDLSIMTKKYDKSINRLARSVMTPVVLFGLFLVFFFVSRFLALLTLFLLWISLVYYIVLHYRKKEERKAKTQKKTKDQSSVKK